MLRYIAVLFLNWGTCWAKVDVLLYIMCAFFHFGWALAAAYPFTSVCRRVSSGMEERGAAFARFIADFSVSIFSFAERQHFGLKVDANANIMCACPLAYVVLQYTSLKRPVSLPACHCFCTLVSFFSPIKTPGESCDFCCFPHISPIFCGVLTAASSRSLPLSLSICPAACLCCLWLVRLYLQKKRRQNVNTKYWKKISLRSAYFISFWPVTRRQDSSRGRPSNIHVCFLLEQKRE